MAVPAAAWGLLSTIASGAVSIFSKGQDVAATVAENFTARRADWLVAVIVLIWSVPAVHAYIDPDGARAALAVLEELPVWYTTHFVWVTILGLGYPLIPKLKR